MGNTFGARRGCPRVERAGPAQELLRTGAASSKARCPNASDAELHFYGDRSLPDYSDVAATDGIDDRRAISLNDLAERFSPILGRNNFSVPRDFRTIEGMRLVMHADYPFNDSANNHEGDWEHINVAITTRERAAQDSTLPGARGGLSVDDVQHLLSSDGGVPLDSLTIRYVTYYFHQHAMLLDHLAPAASHDSPRSSIGRRLTSSIWEDADFVDSALRKRLAVAETSPCGLRKPSA